MIQAIKKNREMIVDLAVNDIALQYAGSAFGVFWAFFKPVMTILIYAVVFQFGMKSTSPVAGIPYIVWFAAGMIPWFFFSDGIRSVTNVYLDYSYLVKKLVFNIELLPVIKILSALFVHAVFLGLMLVIVAVTGVGVSIYALQIIYYVICTITAIYAVGKFTSSIVLFFRDLAPIVNIGLEVGTWVTPIIWSYTILQGPLKLIAYINPVFYLVEGYRDCFFNHIWFWEKGGLTLYYWAFMAVLLIAGRRTYNKLRPEFADVL